MRTVYLTLAVIGAIVPYLFFTAYFAGEGFGPYAFLRALFVNGAAGGLTSDLLISSGVFWVWMARNRTPRPWLFVALNLGIGLSCALPAYLYAREGQDERAVRTT